MHISRFTAVNGVYPLGYLGALKGIKMLTAFFVLIDVILNE